MLEQRGQRGRGQRGQQAQEVAAETTTDPAVIAAGASVVLSWYQFFVRGNREMGLFVGLWPPTVLAFASYFNQTRMADRLRSARQSSSSSSLVDQFMGGR